MEKNEKKPVKKSEGYILRQEDDSVISISDGAVKSIVYLCVKEVPGIADLSDNALGDVIPGSKKENCIRLLEAEEGDLSISVSIKVNYGTKIPEVSKELQESIKTQILNMTGLQVDTVKVRVAALAGA